MKKLFIILRLLVTTTVIFSQEVRDDYKCKAVQVMSKNDVFVY